MDSFWETNFAKTKIKEKGVDPLEKKHFLKESVPLRPRAWIWGVRKRKYWSWEKKNTLKITFWKCGTKDGGFNVLVLRWKEHKHREYKIWGNICEFFHIHFSENKDQRVRILWGEYTAIWVQALSSEELLS